MLGGLFSQDRFGVRERQADCHGDEMDRASLPALKACVTELGAVGRFEGGEGGEGDQRDPVSRVAACPFGDEPPPFGRGQQREQGVGGHLLPSRCAHMAARGAATSGQFDEVGRREGAERGDGRPTQGARRYGQFEGPGLLPQRDRRECAETPQDVEEFGGASQECDSRAFPDEAGRVAQHREARRRVAFRDDGGDELPALRIAVGVRTVGPFAVLLDQQGRGGGGRGTGECGQHPRRDVRPGQPAGDRPG
ncbi:hypothetical protein ACFWBX_10870 [Streptomyces sp. NPDC059991]|uniref:hypothetical protein n=1 Tax=Streptomyces sp. NPDC059991 TaxID=3347028 RepID=UPI00367BAAD9